MSYDESKTTDPDDEWLGPDRSEGGLLGEEGCLFPGKCCMAGTHFESECHTAEMLESLKEYSPAAEEVSE